MKLGPEQGSGGGFRPDNGVRMPQSPRGPATPENPSPLSGLPAARPQRSSRIPTSEVGGAPKVDQTGIALPAVRAASGSDDGPLENTPPNLSQQPVVNKREEPLTVNGVVGSEDVPGSAPSGSDKLPPKEPPSGGTEQPAANEPEQPIVKKIGDTFLVGTNHLVEPDVATMPQGVVDALDSPKHVIIEGRRDLIGIKSNLETLAYAAAEHFGASTHFIGEREDSDRVSLEAGIPPSEIMFRIAHPWLFDHALKQKISGNEAGVDTSVRIVGGILKSVSSVAASMSEVDLQDRLYDWVDGMHHVLQIATEKTDWGVALGFSGSKILSDYDLQLRDAKIFGPYIRERLALFGKKTIIVGSDHLPNMEKVVRGEVLEPPLPWQNFVAGLPSDDRLAVRVFSHLANASRH